MNIYVEPLEQENFLNYCDHPVCATPKHILKLMN